MSINAKTKKIVKTSTATLALVAGESDSVQVLNVATGFVTTLPAATDLLKGATFKFIVRTSVTSNSYTIQGASSADLFYGGVALISSTADNSVTAAPNGSSHYKLVMSGTTTGGLVGTAVTFTCLGLNAWAVDGLVLGSGDVTATGVFA